MAIIQINEPASFVPIYILDSTDVKPTTALRGGYCIERNTGKIFCTDDGANWYEIMFGLSALPASIAAIKAQVDKLAGAAPGVGSTTANWNAAEANVVSIGANDTKNKLHSLLLSIHNLAGNITVRAYMQINGTERHIPDLDRVVTLAANGPGLWIITGTLAIHEILRVTLQSDAVADDGKAVDYDYQLEAM